MVNRIPTSSLTCFKSLCGGTSLRKQFAAGFGAASCRRNGLGDYFWLHARRCSESKMGRATIAGRKKPNAILCGIGVVKPTTAPFFSWRALRRKWPTARQATETDDYLHHAGLASTPWGAHAPRGIGWSAFLPNGQSPARQRQEFYRGKTPFCASKARCMQRLH